MPSLGVSVVRLREAVQARVEATSRRATAREIGLTPRGLELFLAGAKPQAKTLAKLLAWYEQHVDNTDGPPISEADAIRVLLRPIPREVRQQARERITELLRHLYSEVGAELPVGLNSHNWQE
jgi:hypothetical protein